MAEKFVNTPDLGVVFRLSIPVRARSISALLKLVSVVEPVPDDQLRDRISEVVQMFLLDAAASGAVFFGCQELTRVHDANECARVLRNRMNGISDDGKTEVSHD